MFRASDWTIVRFENAMEYWRRLGVVFASKHQAKTLWETMKSVHNKQGAREAHRVFLYWDLFK